MGGFFLGEKSKKLQLIYKARLIQLRLEPICSLDTILLSSPRFLCFPTLNQQVSLEHFYLLLQLAYFFIRLLKACVRCPACIICRL